MSTGNLKRDRPEVVKGIVAGIVGGLVGSFVMTQFHVALYGRGVTGTREPQSHRPVDGNEDAATKTADIVAGGTVGRALTRTEQRIAAPAVHYAFGASMGAGYGAVLELFPKARRSYGVLFGALVWLAADETALPLLGLAHGPRAYPGSVHAEMLVAHLIFGVTADAVTTGVRTRM